MGPQRGQKAFTLQMLAPTPVDEKAVDNAARIGGLSLHVGIAAKVRQREKPERLCRYIARPAVVTVRLSLTRQGDIRVALKTPYRERRLNQARAVPCDGIATIPFVRRAPRGGLSRASRRQPYFAWPDVLGVCSSEWSNERQEIARCEGNEDLTAYVEQLRKEADILVDEDAFQ